MDSQTWSYGVTTVPSRFNELLPRTLTSLAKAGFDKPRLFIDGLSEVNQYANPQPRCWEGGFQTTVHYPPLRTHGNWILSAYELYIRDPHATRYAIFQDDLVTYPNLRQYLDSAPYPDKGYLNLYTFPHNVKPQKGFYESDQQGKGAVGLVFSNEALRTLLCQPHMVDRPLSPHRGHKCVDGGIVTAMKAAGWKEYVHNPSLVQHVGMVSSMDNLPHAQADTFRGENFDALELLEGVSN